MIFPAFKVISSIRISLLQLAAQVVYLLASTRVGFPQATPSIGVFITFSLLPLPPSLRTGRRKIFPLCFLPKGCNVFLAAQDVSK